MARLLFLGFAAFSLPWSSVLVRVETAQVPIATCTAKTSGEATTQMSTLASIGTAQITCPQDTTLDPEAKQSAQVGDAEVFPSPQAAEKVKLSTLLPGCIYVKDKNQDFFTAVQLPEKDVTVYFKCEKDNNPSCWIGLTVSAQLPLGPQACAVGGSSIKLSLTAPHQTAQFMCAQQKSVLPTADGKVYGSDCKTEMNLSDEVPGAKLTRAAGGTMSSFVVTDLPKDSKSLCVVCGEQPTDQGNAICSVHILVSSSALGGSMGLAARAASALGIALAGVTLYYNM